MTYVSICLVWNYIIFPEIVSYENFIIKGYLCVYILYPTAAANTYWIFIMRVL